MENKYEELKQASTLALGWMCAKDRIDDPVITCLAKALQNSGVESVYIKAIVDKAEREGMDEKSR